MENKKVSESYLIDGELYVPLLVDESSLREENNSITFKILSNNKLLGWISPLDDDNFSTENLKPFTLDYYMDIIFNSESFTEIAMYLYTKDNIHYSLKPYKYKGKHIIFQ